MTPQNVRERNLLRSKFASIYIASMVLMGIVFTALWTGKSSSTSTNMNNSLSPDELKQLVKITKADELLHASFNKLQQKEQEYLSLLADTASGNPKNPEQATGKADSAINFEIQKLTNILDSIDKTKMDFTSIASKKGIEKIIASFEAELNSHRQLSTLRALVNSGSVAPSELQEFVKSQDQLQRKDDEIKKLEEQLARALREKNNAISAPIAANYAVSAQKPNPETSASNEAYLTKVNKALKEDNDRLLTEISKYTRLLENGESVAKEKQSDMDKKVRQLTDELYLAHVDCNLSRADAKQVVFNSKQRKDLLAEALGVLKNLAESKDALVQEKVKQKTLQLQNIANTVRD